MAKTRREGWLILADISGYTRFLTGTEAEHADAIVEELVRGLLSSVRAPLCLVKLEGDAIFAYALESDVADAQAIVDRLEDAYHGFRMQLLNIKRSSTCECNACKHAPSLDLKYALHFGEFLVHDLAGHDDLQGADVILVHRLLKNDIVEKTGTRAYLVATEAARSRLGSLDWVDHSESYEHIGEVKCGVRDLHAAFAALKESGTADVKPEDADVVATFDLPVPPSVAWDWHLDESKVVQWQKGITGWKVSANDDGRVRPGAMVHCAHGKGTKSMHIVGWRPPRSISMDSPASFPIPPNRCTLSFAPLEGGGTRVVWRLRMLRRRLFDRLVAWLMSKVFPGTISKWAEKLPALIAADQAQQDPPRLPPRPERHAEERAAL